MRTLQLSTAVHCMNVNPLSEAVLAGQNVAARAAYESLLSI